MTKLLLVIVGLFVGSVAIAQDFDSLPTFPNGPAIFHCVGELTTGLGDEFETQVLEDSFEFEMEYNESGFNSIQKDLDHVFFKSNDTNDGFVSVSSAMLDYNPDTEEMFLYFSANLRTPRTFADSAKLDGTNSSKPVYYDEKLKTDVYYSNDWGSAGGYNDDRVLVSAEYGTKFKLVGSSFAYPELNVNGQSVLAKEELIYSKFIYNCTVSDPAEL